MKGKGRKRNRNRKERKRERENERKGKEREGSKIVERAQTRGKKKCYYPTFPLIDYLKGEEISRETAE